MLYSLLQAVLPDGTTAAFDQAQHTANHWLAFFVTAAALVFGAWFVSPWKRPVVPDKRPIPPATRKDYEVGFRFIPAESYQHYRNPMRQLRRSLGEMSGRQWVRRRKEMSKLAGGYEKLKQMAAQLQAISYRRAAEKVA